MANELAVPGPSPVRGLPDDLALDETAVLIYQSFSEYYDLFSHNRKSLVDSIRNQLFEEYSEVGNTKALSNSNEIAGAYSWYQAEEMQERQMISLRMLLDTMDPNHDVFQVLQAFKQGVGDVADSSFYLARIAVRESSRRLGYGKKLLLDFEEEALAHNRSVVSVHVRSSNERAIQFYCSAGYEVTSSKNLGYYSMQKRL
jgi:ribosomal protein S18 acetylase RimI-like enzyme